MTGYFEERKSSFCHCVSGKIYCAALLLWNLERKNKLRENVDNTGPSNGNVKVLRTGSGVQTDELETAFAYKSTEPKIQTCQDLNETRQRPYPRKPG